MLRTKRERDYRRGYKRETWALPTGEGEVIETDNTPTTNDDNDIDFDQWARDNGVTVIDRRGD